MYVARVILYEKYPQGNQIPAVYEGEGMKVPHSHICKTRNRAI